MAGGVDGNVEGLMEQFVVGPQFRLALPSHPHQPLYRDLARTAPRASYLMPWVRLRGLRDYYGFAMVTPWRRSSQRTRQST